MKLMTIVLTLMFTLAFAEAPVADAHAGFIRRGIERRQARRSDRQARRGSYSMHSSSSVCPTCGKSGVKAIPAVPPTTEAPAVFYKAIKKERILNAST